MANTIAIKYTVAAGGNEVSVLLSYEKEEADGVQVLRCKVDMPLGQIPEWLKPHKFELRALCADGSYQALLNETRGMHTVDAALFMERVQEQVWQSEKPMPKKLQRSR
jgi:hypothetical protein